jgi:hypothetical protein
MTRLIVHRPAMRRLTLGALAMIAMTGLVTGRFICAGEWHVAPSGNDAAAGTQSSPFATLERAVEAARLTRQKESPATNRQPATIRIQGGLHPRSTPLGLDARDSFLRIVGSDESRATLHAGRFI